MKTATNKKAAPSSKSATSTTNARTLHRDRRERQVGGREDRQGWRPVCIGDMLDPALEGILRDITNPPGELPGRFDGEEGRP